MAKVDETPAEKFWGTRKLAKGTGKLILDAFGHWGIAVGGGLLVAPLAWALGLQWWTSGLIGSGIGITALTLREVLQLVKNPGSLHLFDRLLDIAPGFFGGGFGGLVAWTVVASLS